MNTSRAFAAVKDSAAPAGTLSRSGLLLETGRHRRSANREEVSSRAALSEDMKGDNQRHWPDPMPTFRELAFSGAGHLCAIANHRFSSSASSRHRASVEPRSDGRIGQPDKCSKCHAKMTNTSGMT